MAPNRFTGAILIFIILALAACTSRPTPTPAPTFTPTPTEAPQLPTYKVDTQKSIINYTATGALGITFPGTFSLTGNTARLVPEGAGYRIKLDGLIDGSSVTAVNGLVRDALRGNLEVDKYPYGRFIADSKEVVKLSETPTKFTASGTLELHGRTRPIAIPFTAALKDDVITLTGETTLDLLDFEVNVPTAIMNSKITFKATIVAAKSAASAVSTAAATMAATAAATMTAMQSQRLPISLNTAARITEINRLGRGRITRFNWTANRQLIAITSAGAWQYTLEQPATDRPTAVLNDYSGEVIAVVGNSVFLSHRDRSVTLFDLSTLQERHILSASDENIIQVAVNSDGTMLAFVRSSFRIPALLSKDNFTVHLWDIRSSREVQTLQSNSEPVRALEFSPDGKTLGVASVDRYVRLWDVQSGVLLQSLNFKATWPNCLSFSANSTLLAVGNIDGTIELIETKTGKVLYSLPAHTDFVNAVAFSPDGHYIASAGWREHTVKIWQAATGKAVTTLNGHNDTVVDLSFSPDGTSLLSGSLDETIRVWETKTWQTVKVLTHYTDQADDVAFIPTSNLLLSTSGHNARVWNPITSAVLTTVHADSYRLTNLAFTPDGKKLFTGNLNGLVERNPTTIASLFTFESSDIRAVAVSPNGKVLASADSRDIKLWDIATRSLLHTLSEHKDVITGIAFSPDGTILASVSGVIQGDVVLPSGNTLRLWNVQTGQQIVALQGQDHLYSLAFSPDGKRIATGSSNGVIQLWDLASKAELARLNAQAEVIDAVIFSRDGSLLFAGGSDDTIHVWDVQAKAEIRILKGHVSGINSLVLNSDGTLLASASYDGTVRIWAVN